MLGPLSSPTSWHTRKSRVWSVKRDEYNTMYFSRKHLALRRKFELMLVIYSQCGRFDNAKYMLKHLPSCICGLAHEQSRIFIRMMLLSQIRWECWGKCSVACIVQFLFLHTISCSSLLLLLFLPLLRVLFLADWFKVKVSHQPLA